MNGAGSRRKGQTYERELRHFFDEETKYTSVDSNRSGYDGDDMRLEEFPWLSVEAKNHATMTLQHGSSKHESNASQKKLLL